MDLKLTTKFGWVDLDTTCYNWNQCKWTWTVASVSIWFSLWFLPLAYSKCSLVFQHK